MSITRMGNIIPVPEIRALFRIFSLEVVHTVIKFQIKWRYKFKKDTSNVRHISYVQPPSFCLDIDSRIYC